MTDTSKAAIAAVVTMLQGAGKLVRRLASKGGVAPIAITGALIDAETTTIEAASLISALEAERDVLRTALIECGRTVGGGLADLVLTEFLMQVPTEVHLVTERLTEERDAAIIRSAAHEDRTEGAEALNATLQAKLEKAAEALEPFAKHIEEMRFDRDNNGNELPDAQTVGWVYVTIGDFRRARSTLSTLREAGNDQT